MQKIQVGLLQYKSKITMEELLKEFDEKCDELAIVSPIDGINTGGFMSGDIGANDFWLEPKFIKQFLSKVYEQGRKDMRVELEKEYERLYGVPPNVNCNRCNDSGCPACDIEGIYHDGVL